MSESPSDIIRHTFGNDLPEALMQKLRESAETHSYPIGTVLCKQGEVGHTFYVMVSGSAVVIQNLDDGEERLLAVLKAGQFFGEMALLDNAVRMATISAVTPVTVLEIDEVTFEKMVEQAPGVAYEIMRWIVQMLRSNDNNAISDLQIKNTQLRIAYEQLKAAQADLIEKERLEHEMALAANMQRSLLPGKLPSCTSGDLTYSFAAYLEPARRVGGDFYDVVILEDEQVGLLMADVADKGMQAALMMAVTRTLFQREARTQQPPAAVAEAVHHGMLEIATHDDSFVTAFYGKVHLPTGMLTYVRAAQERPVLLRPGEDPATLPGKGRFLGMMPDLTLEEFSAEIRPGDRLILFSDGLPDAINIEGQEYGYARLNCVLAANVHASAQALVDAIVADVDAFTGEAPPYDDLALLIMAVDR